MALYQDDLLAFWAFYHICHIQIREIHNLLLIIYYPSNSYGLSSLDLSIALRIS